MATKNDILLAAMLEVFHPTRADCESLAAAMNDGTTGNAIRQRIQKIRKDGPVATPSKSGAGKPDTPVNGSKRASGKAKSGHGIPAAGDDDDEQESPSKKRSGVGRKRGKVKPETADESEPELLTKKLKHEREAEEFGTGLDNSFFGQEDDADAI